MSLLLKSSRSLARNVESLSKCLSFNAFKNKIPIHQNQIKSYSSNTPFNLNNRLRIFNKPNINVRKSIGKIIFNQTKIEKFNFNFDLA